MKRVEKRIEVRLHSSGLLLLFLYLIIGPDANHCAENNLEHENANQSDWVWIKFQLSSGHLRIIRFKVEGIILFISNTLNLLFLVNEAGYKIFFTEWINADAITHAVIAFIWSNGTPALAIIELTAHHAVARSFVVAVSFADQLAIFLKEIFLYIKWWIANCYVNETWRI